MNRALLIIDVQQGLFGPSPKPYHAKEIIDNINLLITKARTQHIPIIFIQHEDATDLIYQSTDWQLYPSLNANNRDHFIRKTTPDSFHNTELHQLLQTLKIKQCVVCGYASEFCVDTTTRRAAALGYAVTLINDAHTTHDKPHLTAAKIIEHHTFSLTAMTSFGVPITTETAQQLEF